MAYDAKVIADSISPRDDRLTTFEVTFPRIVLAEFNTHRMFSRNSASSRAIPVEKQLGRVMDDPFIPEYWGKNQAGMQATEELSDSEQTEARGLWLRQRDIAVIGACAMIGGIDALKDDDLKTRIATLNDQYGSPEPLSAPLHKQLANRTLEPYMWHTVIVTATDWDNFYALRANPDAQPEIRRPAEMMQEAHLVSVPDNLDYSEWHLPLILPDELDLPKDVLIKISIGRCARVSYLTHFGVREIEKDVELHDSLLVSGHMSPFEHVARPKKGLERIRPKYKSNFKGWVQQRKRVPFESNFAKARNYREKAAA